MAGTQPFSSLYMDRGFNTYKWTNENGVKTVMVWGMKITWAEISDGKEQANWGLTGKFYSGKPRWCVWMSLAWLNGQLRQRAGRQRSAAGLCSILHIARSLEVIPSMMGSSEVLRKSVKWNRIALAGAWLVFGMLVFGRLCCCCPNCLRGECVGCARNQQHGDRPKVWLKAEITGLCFTKTRHKRKKKSLNFVLQLELHCHKCN